ncbi:MAG: 30S ribosomal protein S9 [Candidatus Sumerlaeota bacterium]|nr:30S ribosomal protein S9 [Candidatus Sumerlaeota bacterium]
MAEALEQQLSIGRRKTSTARIYLRPGRGKIVVNGKTIEEYFNSRMTLIDLARMPLKETHTLSKFDIVVNVKGGGSMGQAGAIRHGIARALVGSNAALRATLKKGGMLTRDPRMKERKKYGQPGARKRFQFSKR